jgi:photosystem II stability/assembly factor-like uncharacterized protein
MRRLFPFALFALTFAAHAQWQILDAHTTADLRGVSSPGKGVVWISGTNGTVLRSEDAGYLWQHCTMPPGAEKLDFRGIQAFDANIAIVMSSGKGDLSRLYKTTDGCQTWKLVFTNPDADGFWDAFRLASADSRNLGILFGDPVVGRFPFWTVDISGTGIPFQLEDHKRRPKAKNGEAAFAASNSAIFVSNVFFDIWIGTGGISGARVIKRINHDFDSFGFDSFQSRELMIGHRTESSGIFSIDFRPNAESHTYDTEFLSGIVVGGDYKNPDDASNIAAFTSDAGTTWHESTTQPHGYRSVVAYDLTTKTWITVGPNGTDISTDDGRNWRALKPIGGDAPDADKNWNALSLPYVVGPRGRVGMLEPAALNPAR